MCIWRPEPLHHYRRVHHYRYHYTSAFSCPAAVQSALYKSTLAISHRSSISRTPLRFRRHLDTSYARYALIGQHNPTDLPSGRRSTRARRLHCGKHTVKHFQQLAPGLQFRVVSLLRYKNGRKRSKHSKWKQIRTREEKSRASPLQVRSSRQQRKRRTSPGPVFL